jgi:acyl carrier protein
MLTQETSAPSAPPPGEVRSALARFFAETVPHVPFDVDDDAQALLSAGLLDSLSMVHLTTFLADEFGFELSDDDFTEANFATLGSLIELVYRKRASV